jgi:excisionase family DNA binding protein
VRDCTCCSCKLRASIDRLDAHLTALGTPAKTAPTEPIDGLLTQEAVADRFGCSRKQISAMIKAGQLRAIRLGRKKLLRIPAAEVERLLAGESPEEANNRQKLGLNRHGLWETSAELSARA